MSQNRFRDALDALCLANADAARLFGLREQTVKQMRLGPSSKGQRTPPQGWQATLARVARERAAALIALADELDS